MKLSSTQLRAGALCVNLGLGLGVPGYAAYRYWSLVEEPGTKKPGVAIVERSLFTFSEKEGRVADPEGTNDLRFVSTKMQPRPPELPQVENTNPQPKVEPVETAGPADELKPGKLHEAGWYYAFYFLREDDPSKNFVILRKKDPQAAGGQGAPGAPGAAGAPAAPGSTRANPRAIKPLAGRPVPRPGPRAKGGLPQQPADEISFTVEDGRFIDAEKDVDFMIHSADEKQLVYWHLDDAKRTLYALKYEPQSYYMQQASEIHVTLRDMGEKPPEDPGAPAKKPTFIYPDIDIERLRRKEYMELFEGQGVDPVETPSPGGLRTVKSKASAESNGDAASKGAPMPKPGSAPTKSKPGPITPANKPPGPQPKDLKEAMSSPEMKDALKAMPAAEKKQMLDALKGIKPAK